MPTEITPNGSVGRRVDRKQRRLKLKTERDSLKAGLQSWLSNAQYNTTITDFATLKTLYGNERKLLRDALQALNVLISVQLEEMAEEEAN